MNRAIVLLTLLLSFFVFANNIGVGGTDPVAGQVVRTSVAVVGSESQKDRCQIAASCSASCILCAVAFLDETTSLGETRASGADLHRALATQTQSERQYRPPKSDGLTNKKL